MAPVASRVNAVVHPVVRAPVPRSCRSPKRSFPAGLPSSYQYGLARLGYNPQRLRRRFTANSALRAEPSGTQWFRWAGAAIVLVLVTNSAPAQTKPPQAISAPVCINCHRAATLRYLSTAMGKSFVPPQAYPSAVVKHERSGSVLRVTMRHGTMFHRLEEDGFSAEYPIRYQVGGGMGSTFLIQLGNYLFESPLSWYNGFGWDVSPGYASKPVLEFDRGVAKECIDCHATGARFDDPDGRHLVSTSLQPITCERCHGPSAEHVQHPSASNILNPAKLSGRVRDSICEQCHLEGAHRILNPGKDWTDYHPGEVVENIFATYVMLGNDKPEVPLASEVEQLAESRCAQASQGKLWCGTCHNPHREPRPRQLEIRAICTSCHQKLSPDVHPVGLRECTSCHMPTTTKVTISHASHTDHRILRHPATPQSPQKSKLVAWREPPEQFRQRDLGLAELMLSPEENEDLWRDGARQLLALNHGELDNDAEVVTALEDYYFRTGDIAKAVEFGRRSVELNPSSASAALTFARVLQSSGAASEAEAQFLRAIRLDPSLKEAYGRLAVYYAGQRRTQDATSILDRYLEWNSNEIFFHQMKQKIVSQSAGSRPSP